MMLESTVKKYFRDRGYGFIKNGHHKDIYVQEKDLSNCKFLTIGTKVSFECHVEGNKLVAKNVRRLTNRNPNQGPPINFVMT